jgi:hypothetical protein
MEPDNTAHRLKLQTRLSVLTLVIGVVLMMRQMYADDEPGALPLLLVAVGAVWLVIARVRVRGTGKRQRVEPPK